MTLLALFYPQSAVESPTAEVRPTPYEWKPRKYKSADEIAEEIRQQRIKMGVLPPDEIQTPTADKLKPEEIAPEISINYDSLTAELRADFTRARYKAQIAKLTKLIIEYQKAREDEEIAIALLFFAA